MGIEINFRGHRDKFSWAQGLDIMGIGILSCAHGGGTPWGLPSECTPSKKTFPLRHGWIIQQWIKNIHSKKGYFGAKKPPSALFIPEKCIFGVLFLSSRILNYWPKKEQSEAFFWFFQYALQVSAGHLEVSEEGGFYRVFKKNGK